VIVVRGEVPLGTPRLWAHARFLVRVLECGSRCLLAILVGTALLLSGCASMHEESSPDPSAKLSPSARTLWSMSRVLASQEKDAEREQVLLRLVTSHPDFLPPYIDLAELYVARGQVESAIELLNSGTRVAPADPVIRNNLGVCYLSRGRYDEALEQFTFASSSAPGNVRARSNMAVALGKLGRYDECLALYKQLVPPADAHWNLAVLCQGRGDADRATREFETAKRLGARSADDPR
jgi:tetratricopeptide (TPR) repeat protein